MDWSECMDYYYKARPIIKMDSKYGAVLHRKKKYIFIYIYMLYRLNRVLSSAVQFWIQAATIIQTFLSPQNYMYSAVLVKSV